MQAPSDRHEARRTQTRTRFDIGNVILTWCVAAGRILPCLGNAGCVPNRRVYAMEVLDTEYTFHSALDVYVARCGGWGLDFFEK